MQKLALHHTNEIQGKFTLQKLNLLFTFQVNCPGCFLYGIPVVNKLYHKFYSQLSFLGLSTAFEDFAYNTLENTKLLLGKKELVGETQKALKQYGFKKYPQPIDFPIAMDKTADESFDIEAAALQICRSNPNFTIWPSFEQESMKRQVLDYLKKLQTISLTFTLNQFQGTPSFVLFNNEYEILTEWFGHKEYQEIEAIIQSALAPVK